MPSPLRLFGMNVINQSIVGIFYSPFSPLGGGHVVVTLRHLDVTTEDPHIVVTWVHVDLTKSSHFVVTCCHLFVSCYPSRCCDMLSPLRDAGTPHIVVTQCHLNVMCVGVRVCIHIGRAVT